MYNVALITALSLSPLAAPVVTPSISYQVQGLSSLAVSLMRGDFHSDVTAELNRYGFGSVESIQSYSSSGVTYGDPLVKQTEYYPVGFKVTSYTITLGSIAGEKNSATVQVDYRVENDGDTFLDLQVFGSAGSDGVLALASHAYRDYLTENGTVRTQGTIEQWNTPGVMSTSMATTQYNGDVVVSEYSSHDVQINLVGVDLYMPSNMLVGIVSSLGTLVPIASPYRLAFFVELIPNGNGFPSFSNILSIGKNLLWE